MRESLEAMKTSADCIVVSQTPGEALVREWQEHDIAKYVNIIAGQEMGKKSEHIAFATKDRYTPDHILMIGDAFGDYKAAKANNACFFPINPGHEEESWELFYKEALPKFLKEEFVGAYEEKLFNEFKKFLPSTPPWKK